jgi:hypothetical protein
VNRPTSLDGDKHFIGVARLSLAEVRRFRTALAPSRTEVATTPVPIERRRGVVGTFQESAIAGHRIGLCRECRLFDVLEEEARLSEGFALAQRQPVCYQASGRMCRCSE